MARSIQTLIRKLLGHADCKLRAPSRRLPAAARKTWPKDLLEFYLACDGGKLFDDGSYGWAAPKGSELRPLESVMAERWHHREPDTKTVKTWYFIRSFSDIPEWMFAIDLHPDRLGWV